MRIVSALWLLFWILVSAWACQTLAHAWPYVHLHPQVALLFALPGILFQSANLLHMQWRGQALMRWRRAGARVVAIVCGFILAGHLWEVLDGTSMGRFERALAPWVARMHAEKFALCPPETDYAVGPALLAYLEESNAVRAPAELHFGPARFVLVLGGRSMDIDGSSLFYDSATRRWKKVHNDQLQQTAELQNLTRDLTVCKIPLR